MVTRSPPFCAALAVAVLMGCLGDRRLRSQSMPAPAAPTTPRGTATKMAVFFLPTTFATGAPPFALLPWGYEMSTQTAGVGVVDVSAFGISAFGALPSSFPFLYFPLGSFAAWLLFPSPPHALRLAPSLMPAV